jgi:adenylate kinase
MNLVIFGPPGAGKGTYASRLATELKIANIATGDIFRQEIKGKTDLGTRIADFVQKGLLVPDSVVIEVLKKRMSEPNSQRGFILDGYPRTVDQAKALEKITKVDAIIQLNVPEWVIVERLSNRRICRNCGAIYNIKYSPKPKVNLKCDKCGAELYQREDDKAEVIKERLRVYERQTEPLIEYYEKSKTVFVAIDNIDVGTPIEEVFQRIMDGLKRVKLL